MLFTKYEKYYRCFMFKYSLLICHLCRDDASHITDKLRKITVADIIKSMEVSVIPFAVYKKAKVCRSDQKKKKSRLCSIHKLKKNLYKKAHRY